MALSSSSVSFEKHFVSKMIDECWDKLKKKCISLDELRALEQAFDVFPAVDSRKERAIVQAKIEELENDVVLSQSAEQLSIDYDENKLIEEAMNQPDLSVYPEAEEEGADEQEEEEED